MVYLLVLVYLLVDVVLHGLGGPHDVPFIAFGLVHAVRLKDCLDEPCIGLDHLVEHVELRLLVLAWLREAQHVDVVSIDLKDAKFRSSTLLSIRNEETESQSDPKNGRSESQHQYQRSEISG